MGTEGRREDSASLALCQHQHFHTALGKGWFCSASTSGNHMLLALQCHYVCLNR